MHYTPLPHTLQKLKDVIRSAEAQAQAELHSLQNAFRSAQEVIHGEIHANTPNEYAAVQAARWEAAGNARIRLSAFDVAQRKAELLNDEAYRGMLQDALSFLEVEFTLYDARRRETILERVAKFISNLDEEAQPEVKTVHDFGVYGPTILRTPKERLEALRHQVDVFPADWPFERIVGEMAGLYSVLIEPAKPPKPLQLPLKRISIPPGLNIS